MFKPNTVGEIVHEFGCCARRGISEAHTANRLITRGVMIDDRNGNSERAHRVGERAKATHIVDIEHEQQVDILECFGAQGRAVLHAREQKLIHRGPRRGIHDSHVKSQLREQMSHAHFRTATIAVGIDVRGERNLHAWTQQRVDRTHRRGSGRRNSRYVRRQWARFCI